jgi:hypothetical protein
MLPHDTFKMCGITKGEVVVMATVVEIQSKSFLRAQFLKFDASAANVVALLHLLYSDRYELSLDGQCL